MRKSQNVVLGFLREESSEGVAFIHVDAYEQRVGRSYSKVDQIKAILYIIRLLFDGHDVNCSDIGIITPYGAQVDDLKKRFRDSNLHCIESASVDGFSGQGKVVIFLSIVRSNDKSGLGCIANPKRLCLSISTDKRCFSYHRTW